MRVTEAQVREIRRLASVGYRAEDIAAEVGCAKHVAAKWATGWWRTRPRRAESRNPRLPDDCEREARVVGRYAAGDTMQAIADTERVSRERVRQIIAAYEVRTGERIPRPGEAGRAQRPFTPPPTLAQRLLRRCERVGECWVWRSGTLERVGRTYAVANTNKQSAIYLGQQYAHRAAYALWVGPIPRAHFVQQTCGNDLCINPAHLQAIPAGERLRQSPAWDTDLDCWRHLQPPVKRSHCKRGHEMAGDNLRWCNGVRRCRVCANQRDRERYAEQARAA